MISAQDWRIAADTWLCTQAHLTLKAWLKTAKGRKYLNLHPPARSAYHCGFRQPGYLDDGRAALAANDETSFMAIWSSHS